MPHPMLSKFVIICSILVYFFNTSSFAEQSNYYPEPDLTNEDHVNVIVPEMRRLFHLTPNISNLPFYKVLPLKTVFVHGDGSLEVEAVSVRDQRYKLNLIPIKHNVFSEDEPKTLIWTVETTPEQMPNYTYRIVDMEAQDMTLEGDFYEDQENSAILLVKKERGYFHFDGVIGESLQSQTVRVLPKSWQKIYGSEKDGKHVVFKRQVDSSNDEVDDEAETDTLYIKTLVVIDENLFFTLGHDIKETIRYTITYWNAVNLKFQKLEEPKIRILVTGIIIAKNETAVNYVHQAKVFQNSTRNRFTIKIDDMLLHAHEYFKEQFIKDTGFSNYEIVVIMTPLSENQIFGKARTIKSGICTPYVGTAYVNNYGDFLMLSIAAHEVAHLLSIPHDELDISTGEAEDVNIESIMSEEFVGAPKSVWSKRTKEHFKRLNSQHHYDCLKKEIISSYPTVAVNDLEVF